MGYYWLAMAESSLLYSALLIFSGIVALAVLILAFPRRSAQGGLPLVYMMAAMMVWSWAYALHWLFPTWPAPFFWLDATYIGVVFAPVVLLAFALQLSQNGAWLNRSTITILLIEPLVTLLILWSDPYHNLFYGNLRQAGMSSIYAGGPWFWINIVYVYALCLTAFGILAYAWIKSRGGIYRKQIGISLGALGMLFVVSFITLVGLNPFPNLDLTPILFSISGIFLGTGLLRYRMLDLAPLAQSVLLDQMLDGMLVVDEPGRVIEANRVAARLIGTSIDQLIGKDLRPLLESQPGFGNKLPPRGATGRFTITFLGDVTLDIQISPLVGKDALQRGVLITWRDISHIKKVEEDLRAANESLSKHLRQIESLQDTLREQAIRDALTGLFNRRFIEITLQKEIERAHRKSTRLSLFLLDIDHFKQINDTYGHEAGDQALGLVAQQLESRVRKGDWVGRFGGDEFLVVLVDTGTEDALERGVEICATFACANLEVAAELSYLTVSAGVATYPDHGEDIRSLIRSADQALYRVKQSGRNRVEQA